MTRRHQKNDKQQTILGRTRERIECARRRLTRSVLGALVSQVLFTECKGAEGDPQIAVVDCAQGVICINPHRRHDFGEPEWTYVLAHLLAHLGLKHAERGEHRDRKAWHTACEYAADNLVTSFKIGKAPEGFGPSLDFLNLREEEIYDRLTEDRKAQQAFRTFGGDNQLDIVSLPKAPEGYRWSQRRHDWDNLFAEGIRSALESAVNEAADTLGTADIERRKTWKPGELAKKWVMHEMPLLGAVAANMTIIGNSEVCDRMDIAVAAINPSLGEIYFNPARGLTQDEVLFVYVHELLHAALLHHTRTRGRDHWLWNTACDFVINGWIMEMGIGAFPRVGGLYDPSLKGMSADEVYDLLNREPAKCKKARGFRGGLGDILLEGRGNRLFRGDVTMMDDLYRRCMSAGMACADVRGHIPAGLLEEIQSLFSPAVPWDVELARWMDAHVPALRDPLRSYARASRRQASTPNIPRPGRFMPQEWKDACTFGVVLDTSGSMDRELLGRALGAIASYSEARDVPRVRLVLCDAAPYDQGFVAPTELRGRFPVKGRGGTVLQPALNYIMRQSDFPVSAPVMVITDGWCEEELLIPREHCFLLPRKEWKEGAMPLRTTAPTFRVLKEGG